jgi:hypothetical protein
MAQDWDSQFDPGLRQPFVNCADRFEAVFRDLRD